MEEVQKMTKETNTIQDNNFSSASLFVTFCCVKFHIIGNNVGSYYDIVVNVM